MEYRIVFRQTNKVGPGFRCRDANVDISSDVGARRQARRKLAALNQKGPEQFELLRIVKVLQKEINTEISLT